MPFVRIDSRSVADVTEHKDRDILRFLQDAYIRQFQASTTSDEYYAHYSYMLHPVDFVKLVEKLRDMGIMSTVAPKVMGWNVDMTSTYLFNGGNWPEIPENHMWLIRSPRNSSDTEYVDIARTDLLY